MGPLITTFFRNIPGRFFTRDYISTLIIILYQIDQVAAVANEQIQISLEILLSCITKCLRNDCEDLNLIYNLKLKVLRSVVSYLQSKRKIHVIY